jgi:tRNA threonylcarbamoyladenosine biosynthesis protein TsaB
MLILGIDTSGKSGGVSLAEASEHSFRVLGSAAIAGGTFSAQLVPTVASLLKEHGKSVRDLDGFAVASGPGSFTGLRVGLSAIKGLAEVLNKPIATVSILQAMAAGIIWAANDPQTNPLCRVILDASRGQVFFGEYECLHPVAPKILSESLIDLSEVAERSQGWGHSAILVTPDVDLIEALRRLVKDPFLVNVAIVNRPTSAEIAQVGANKLLAGETVTVEALDANYLRRSDAELFFKGTRG